MSLRAQKNNSRPIKAGGKEDAQHHIYFFFFAFFFLAAILRCDRCRCADTGCFWKKRQRGRIINNQVARKNDFSLLLYAKHACAFRLIVYMKNKKNSSMWITFKHLNIKLPRHKRGSFLSDEFIYHGCYENNRGNKYLVTDLGQTAIG